MPGYGEIRRMQLGISVKCTTICDKKQPCFEKNKGIRCEKRKNIAIAVERFLRGTTRFGKKSGTRGV